MFRKKSIFENWGKSIFDSFIKFHSGADRACREEHLCPATTYIHFVNEKLLVYVRQGEGCVEFLTEQEELLHRETLPVVTGGRGIYPSVCLGAQGGKVSLQLTVCRWIDNYPHCDGESDRWDWEKIGCHQLCFDTLENTATWELYDPQ